LTRKGKPLRSAASTPSAPSPAPVRRPKPPTVEQMEKQRADVRIRHPDAAALYQKVNAEEEEKVAGYKRLVEGFIEKIPDDAAASLLSLRQFCKNVLVDLESLKMWIFRPTGDDGALAKLIHSFQACPTMAGYQALEIMLHTTNNYHAEVAFYLYIFSGFFHFFLYYLTIINYKFN